MRNEHIAKIYMEKILFFTKLVTFDAAEHVNENLC